MKSYLIFISTFFIQTAKAQQIEKFYDYKWNPCEAINARFYSIIDKKDSLWERKDYFIHERSLQMAGIYTDTSCKIPQGHFEYFYPNKNLQSTGDYQNGKKEGVWLSFYTDASIKDSTTYLHDKKIGTSYQWHQNGFLGDSAVWNTDGSGVEVAWFDNGNPSFAGMYAAENKMMGKWQFFHRNGKVSSIELFNDGVLKDKQYFDENGNPEDSTNNDKPAQFPGGINAWMKYLIKNIYFPSQYKFENADKAVVVVNAIVDEDGNVTNVELNTSLYPAFDNIALNVIKKSPKWIPSISHNRKVKYVFTQAVFFSQQTNITGY